MQAFEITPASHGVPLDPTSEFLRQGNKFARDEQFTDTESVFRAAASLPYDEGNRIAKTAKNSQTEYFWDHRNRLVKVVDNGKSVEYDYDYQNRLVRRNDELFVHDGWQIACTLQNGKIEHRYLWGAAQDELLAMDDCWALRDHLNTVRKIVDAKGCVVASLEYNAFGALVNATGEMPLFRYTGKLFDEATGLQWNINRWYDSAVGRWISEDPIKFEGSGTNLYRYVSNSPLNATDSEGLEEDKNCNTSYYAAQTWTSQGSINVGAYEIKVGYTFKQKAGSFTVCDTCCKDGKTGKSVKFNYSADVDITGSIAVSWQWNGLLGLGVLNAGVQGEIYAQAQGNFSFYNPNGLKYCPPTTLEGVTTVCGEWFNLTIGGRVTGWVAVPGYSLSATIAGGVTYPFIFCASADVATGTISNHYSYIGQGTGGLRFYGYGRGIGFDKSFDECLLGNCTNVH